jgi:hypothetical protein
MMRPWDDASTQRGGGGGTLLLILDDPSLSFFLFCSSVPDFSGTFRPVFFSIAIFCMLLGSHEPSEPAEPKEPPEPSKRESESSEPTWLFLTNNGIKIVRIFHEFP